MAARESYNGRRAGGVVPTPDGGERVPRICEFYGIVIQMFYREHGPAHFHASYGEFEAIVGIDPVEVLGGRLPPRAMRLVREWATLHRDELAENWRRARRRGDLESIEPLP
jgi:Domain of unknown function (DUF4160)